MNTVAPEVTCALLFQNIEDVKNYSKLFRSLGIIPYFYEDLKTFWTGIQDSAPDLIFVDVRRMSEGELILKNHPQIIEEKTQVMFYVNERSLPLMISTFEFKNLGLVHEGTFSKSQFEQCLKRFFEIRNLKLKLDESEEEIKQKDSELEKFLKQKNAFEEKNNYRQYISTLSKEIEGLKGKVDYFKAIESFFERIEEIDEFVFLELSFNGQKLISPLSSSSKFRMIPNLWLGSQCLNGIELFAQNIASQIVAEAMGSEVISLHIKGQNSNPDKLIFIKTRVDSFLEEFDWTLFEEMLNALYASYILRSVNDRTVEKRKLNCFEALQIFDSNVFGSGIEFANKETVMIDLSSLFDVIKKRKSTRFYFEKFYNDFLSRLEIQTRIDFQVVEMSFKHWVFIVKDQRFEDFYRELRDFSSKFQYWKYFESADSFLTMEIKPKIKQIPVSSFSMFTTIDEIEDTPEVKFQKERLAKERTRELIWGRESGREI